jgi:hypothetical protein
MLYRNATALQTLIKTRELFYANVYGTSMARYVILPFTNIASRRWGQVKLSISKIIPAFE